MSDASIATRWNLDALESAHARWLRDPSSVDESWRAFFDGYELGAEQPAALAVDARAQIGVVRLIEAYRGMGHMLARLDPLSDPPATHPLLDLSQFHLGEADL